MAFLEASTVSYQYPGSNYGVHNFSMSVSPGNFISIEGRSGSGKSTIARCLSGLIPHLYHGKMHGEVQINNHPTHALPLWQLSQQCGMVFQNPSSQMLGLSVEEEIVFGLENLGLKRAEIKTRLEYALDGFGLNELRSRSPQTLSGGEQQKVALAAIMARRPDILVLDEPLSMLDITAATTLVADLEKLAQNGTGVVIFEHRAEFIQHIPELQKITLNGHHPQPPTTHQADQTKLHFRKQPEAGELVVKNLNVHLSGQPILKNMNFSVKSGETVAVVGRNGSGKTTLLRSLTGLQKFKGSVTINGQQPDFGMVFQNADLQLFNATVQDEILYRVPSPDMDTFHQILQALGLTAYTQTPPLLLSEGEKKRVALATILMRQPRHGIMLDEPSLGQDQAHKQMLIHLAKLLNQAGLLVMMTTHDITLAAQADRIILLGKGTIITEGSWSELVNQAGAWEQAGLHIPEWMRKTEPA